MGVKYVGQTRDFSGYGEAARHDIASLLAVGIDVTVDPQHYTLELADFGVIGEAVAAHENRDIEYDTIIIHTTPNIFPRFKEPAKRIIGRVFWETDKLPQEFAEGIESTCTEVWTGSEYNAEAIRKAGVRKPIFIIPQAIDTTIDPNQFSSYITPSKGTYSFYSIFEWTNRKNPLALLEAFWREFEHTEGVSLNIKTYLDDFTYEKRREIDEQIEGLRIKLGLERFAPVYLARNLMNRSQVYGFHRSFDCFVSAHRGEGWGLPQMEALLLGKPVITTNCGGIAEYLVDGIDALLLPYTLIPLTVNNRNQRWYTSDQKWADVEVATLRQAMRRVFEDQDGAAAMGLNVSNHISEKFNFTQVGKLMKERLDA